MKFALVVLFGSVLVLVGEGRPSQDADDEVGTGTTATPATSAMVSEGRGGATELDAPLSLAALAHNESALVMLSIMEALGRYGSLVDSRPSTKIGHKGSHANRRETTGVLMLPTSPPKVRFPNQGSVPSVLTATPTATAACSIHDTFCENIQNYPTHEVNAVLTHGANKYSEYFEDSALNITDRGLLHGDEIGSRFGISTQLCKSRTRLIAPQAGRTVNGDFKFIAKNETYQQAIVVEECEKVGEKCNNLVSFPPNIEARCVQKYVTRRLVVVDMEKKGLETDKFQVPSCCSCELRDKKLK